MMNRQMRRATERSEKRQEKQPLRTPRTPQKPAPRKSAAKKKQRSSKSASSKSTSSKSASSKSQGGSTKKSSSRQPRQMPNWLMGSLAFFALFFVVLPQGIPPAPTINQTPIMYYAAHASAFAIFAYFLCTWLLRRNTANALLLTAIVVVPLALGIELSKFMQMNQELWRSVIFVPLALAGGAGGIWLANAVEKAREQMAKDAI